ncbi:MAG: phosphoribosylanthranilate isomerase [Porticoccaceae bacterium]
MTVTRVKICGITRAVDARAAADAGADAIGMVFYAGSARCVAVDDAVAIAAAVGPFVTTVALFVNPDPGLVAEVVAAVRPRLLQFHGDEDSAFCERFGQPYIKAIRVAPDTDIAAAVAAHPAAGGFLFDAWSADAYGGTGKTFDWKRLAALRGFPLILAGGLNPDNVGAAVRLLSPYGVDVSGGVESAPGIKDAAMIARFVAAARAL